MTLSARMRTGLTGNCTNEGWLATPMADSWHGKLTDLDDSAVRRRIADDLGTPMFKEAAF